MEAVGGVVCFIDVSRPRPSKFKYCVEDSEFRTSVNPSIALEAVPAMQFLRTAENLSVIKKRYRWGCSKSGEGLRNGPMQIVIRDGDVEELAELEAAAMTPRLAAAGRALKRLPLFL